MHPEQHTELDNLITMQHNLRTSAKGSNDANDVHTSPTGYEPNDMVFNELGNSQGSCPYFTPPSDLDIDDATLGKLLDEAHREHADYRNPEGVSVSQSSLSVVFDRTGKPVGERNVDQSIGFGVTRNTYSAHSKFSENTQAEKVVDRTGKPVGESSSNAQIRTLLDEQRQMIIEEYCEKIGHHELQAARAEEECRILREELWRQQKDFREVHQQSLTEMEDLRKFQSSKDVENCRYTLQPTRKRLRLFRIILSVNQLSVYGAVAALCEEFESHQDGSGEPEILMGQSIVLGEIKAEIPLQNENSFTSSNSMATARFNELNRFHQKAK